MAILALALIFATLAAAHPGHGPAVVRIQSFAFAPVSTLVEEGQPVIWRWAGEQAIDRQHSVTADPGQAESFDSDAGTAPAAIQHARGDYFTHSFSKPGTYTYHCKVHPSMEGEVVVVDDPTTGGNSPSGGTAPQIWAISVASGKVCRKGRGCRRARAVLKLKLSARAEVIARVQRRAARHPSSSPPRWRPVRTLYLEGRRGVNRVALPVAKLRPGRYRVLARAYGSAGSRPDRASAGFRLGRR